MTAQVPERMLIDNRIHALTADPLYRIFASRRMTFNLPGHGWSTANYRCYIGTWEVIDGQLYLVHLNTDWGQEGELPDDLRRKFLRAIPAAGFPIFAYWFSGRLRIPMGRRLIYSHRGWSSWYERERVMTFRKGILVRDREVDTRRILAWWLKRNPETAELLDGRANAPFAPLFWYDTSEQGEEEDDDDWWPLGYPRRTSLRSAV
jgi:hypothetical protein